ncbi:MAG TPA: sugar transferase [Acidobacteriota bacterium]|nr:sugar transferase [Acidobacteriota bacterium]
MATSMSREPILNVRVSRATKRSLPYDEVAFEQALVLERKRSERSGKPFLLVCVDVYAVRDDSGRLDPVFRDLLFSELGCMLRETDIIGWRREDHVAGAILTELGKDATPDLTGFIEQKVEQCLASRLPASVFSKIRVRVYFFPTDLGKEIPEETRETLFPDLQPRKPSRKGSQILKRIMDLCGSLVLLVLLAPLMALIALLVKATSKGPVFYVQRRIGQYGQSFSFLKFRSMYTNVDSSVHERYIDEYIRQGKNAAFGPDGKAIFKLVEDPRVTPLGRFLRKTSMDELPQLFNVLKGEMSLVGPRPPIPYEILRYDVWHRRRILEVKPGITGLWQVFGRSRTSFDDMVRLDLQYARNWSLWLDLKLLLLTPIAVFRGDGAC